MLKNLIGNIEGMTPSRLTAIAMELSVMDKTAVVQKDKKKGISSQIPLPKTLKLSR